MTLLTLPNGDTAERRNQSIVARFAGRRRVLSDSPLLGGVREDLTAAFNFDCKVDGKTPDRLLAPTYGAHLGKVAELLGLDPAHTTGLSTAADTQNAAVVTETCGNTAVTAIVTGGVAYNAGRAGDPACWDEAVEPLLAPPSGTINLLLFLSPNLPAGTLARALVTAVEAKAAALADLQVPSCAGSGVATGTGTDGAILISDMESPLTLTFAGKHCKLGELIGVAVRRAVKEALLLENGLSPASRTSVSARLRRFGLGDVPAKLDRDPKLAAGAALLSHLLGELQAGTLPAEPALYFADRLLYDMGICEFPASEPGAEPSAIILSAFARGLRQLEEAHCLS